MCSHFVLMKEPIPQPAANAAVPRVIVLRPGTHHASGMTSVSSQILPRIAASGSSRTVGLTSENASDGSAQLPTKTPLTEHPPTGGEFQLSTEIDH